MAQFYTDFSEYPIAAGIPTGWTIRSTANTYAWSINDGTGFGLFEPSDFVGGRCLEVYGDGSTEANHTLTWDQVGTASQVDTIMRISSNEYVNVGIGSVVRAPSSDDDHHWSALSLADDRIRTRRDNTVEDVLHSQAVVDGSFIYIRLLVDGTNYRVTASMTLNEVTGTTPTAGWLVDVADPVPADTGHVGVGIRTPLAPHFCDWIGVGTDGDAAPTEPVATEVLATPTGWTFTKTTDVAEVTGSWDSVTDADSYDYEVEEWDGAAWQPFAASFVTAPTTTFTLTETDGVQLSTLYRSRARAVPAV